MKKRILAVLLAVCMFAGLLPMTAMAADKAVAGATTVEMPDGSTTVTLSAPIIRVDTELVETVIGSKTNRSTGAGGGGASTVSLYEAREQPVYVLPIGTTITLPDGYVGNTLDYSIKDEETGETLKAYIPGDGGLLYGSYTPTSTYWLTGTVIVCVGNNGSYDIEVKETKTETDGGSITEYEYYTEKSIAAGTGIFFRFELPEGDPFEDVKLTDDTSWYYDAVRWAAACDITTGVTETTFAPDSTCTRAQLITFLWRILNCPEPENDENPFVDVKLTDDTSWYYDAVLWAASYGITLGTDKTHFSPDAECTRAQVATFIWRCFGSNPAEENPFTDVKLTDNTDWYYDAVLWCAEEGIVEGYGDGRFGPDDACTRAQIVTMFYRTW